MLKADIKDNYRIIAISDIHGHLDVFERLLEKVNLQAEDYLVIIGDMINKGPKNIDTLKKIRELIKRPKTYILKGNHEFFMCHHMLHKQDDERFLNFLKDDGFYTYIHEAALETGFDLYQCKDMKALVDWHMNLYQRDYEFMDNLPIVLHMGDMIFVHGGYDPEVDIDSNEVALLKFDNFNELSKVHDKTVIVGHWPTANLRDEKNTNIPHFNGIKNIIFIDGGLGVKPNGELNALIIEKAEGKKTISHVQENMFEHKIIKKSHVFHEEEKYFINYPHFEIELISKDDHFSYCKHVQSGKEISIFNSLLVYKDGRPEIITTYINHFLNLNVGDEVQLVEIYGECALVKHGEEFGWVFSWQL